ncbi:MAG: DUF3488 domain-containing transglutaminase family protein [Thauera sp.]|nr:DUF3488 domain-containing transglutaminase family protein [Thauera sp.]
MPLDWPQRRRRTPAAEATSRPASLTRDQGLWLIGATAVTLAPHAPWLPGWLAALCGILLGARALLLWQGRRPPPGLILVLLAAAGSVGVRMTYGHFFGKDPGVALLALLLCLKLLEIRSARDVVATILLCFFMQLAVFFEDQSLPVALLALFGTLVAVITLLAQADPAASQRERVRSGAVLFAQGIPFMLVLFVLFPRIQGPLWGLPADASSASSGLSDSMSPGSISELSESAEIAFRAEFIGAPPEPAQRYWRGPVMTTFDGRTWRAARTQETGTPSYTPTGRRFDYRLTLEPHGRRWVLALDFPGLTTTPLRYASTNEALLSRPVERRTRLELSAYPDTPTGLDEPPAALAASLSLPEGYNPQSIALATRLAGGARDHNEILERVIAHLRTSGLIYTLQPPLVGRDSVDAFLFDTRRGFCEHFASAFVVLMRAVGVPARVVAGYQGGELNPIDGNLVVRQSDAHAWAEVWLAGRGWIRVDPTALAAPQRIESGLASALPAGEALPLTMRQNLAWLRDLRHRWEALSNAWNQRILGYNPDRQKELLERLGFGRDDWGALVGVMTGLCVSVLGMLIAWASWQYRKRDPLQRCWASFCGRLARKGYPREPWEGPLAYGKRLSESLPEHAQSLLEIAACYARARYGGTPTSADIRTLNHKISRLRL